MDDSIILTELEAQAASIPRMSPGFSYGAAEFQWLGRTIALIRAYDPIQAISVQVAAQSIEAETLAQGNIATIRLGLYDAIETLKLRLHRQPGGVFAKGKVYDFFREFTGLLGLVQQEVFVIDPYLDQTIFDYLTVIGQSVKVRLLMKDPKRVAAVKLGMEKFVAQHGQAVETRTAEDIHDRVVFVDRKTCYLIGGSIKDQAKFAPGFLVPWPAPDLFKDKLASYEAIWTTATLV